MAAWSEYRMPHGGLFLTQRGRTAVLRCGHPAVGQPILSNPDKWWCDECRQMKERKQ